MTATRYRAGHLVYGVGPGTRAQGPRYEVVAASPMFRESLASGDGLYEIAASTSKITYFDPVPGAGDYGARSWLPFRGGLFVVAKFACASAYDDRPGTYAVNVLYLPTPPPLATAAALLARDDWPFPEEVAGSDIPDWEVAPPLGEPSRTIPPLAHAVVQHFRTRGPVAVALTSREFVTQLVDFAHSMPIPELVSRAVSSAETHERAAAGFPLAAIGPNASPATASLEPWPVSRDRTLVAVEAARDGQPFAVSDFDAVLTFVADRDNPGTDTVRRAVSSPKAVAIGLGDGHGHRLASVVLDDWAALAGPFASSLRTLDDNTRADAVGWIGSVHAAHPRPLAGLSAWLTSLGPASVETFVDGLLAHEANVQALHRLPDDVLAAAIERAPTRGAATGWSALMIDALAPRISNLVNHERLSRRVRADAVVHRLRHAGAPAVAEAVLSADGHVLNAVGAATTRQERADLVTAHRVLPLEVRDSYLNRFSAHSRDWADVRVLVVHERLRLLGSDGLAVVSSSRVDSECRDDRHGLRALGDDVAALIDHDWLRTLAQKPTARMPNLYLNLIGRYRDLSAACRTWNDILGLAVGYSQAKNWAAAVAGIGDLLESAEVSGEAAEARALHTCKSFIHASGDAARLLELDRLLARCTGNDATWRWTWLTAFATGYIATERDARRQHERSTALLDACTEVFGTRRKKYPEAVDSRLQPVRELLEPHGEPRRRGLRQR